MSETRTMANLFETDEIRSQIDLLEEEVEVVGRNELRTLLRDVSGNYSVELPPEENTTRPRYFGLNRTSKSNFGKHTKMPWRFLDTVPTDSQLFQHTSRHAFNNLGEQNLKVVTQKGLVAGVLEGDDPWLSTREVYDRVVSQIPANSRVANAHFGRKYNTFEFVTDVAEAPPRRAGEFSHAGIELFIRDGIPSVSEFVYTMICSNGMIGIKRGCQSHISGRGDSILDELNGIVGDIMAGSQHLLGHFIQSDEKPLENPESFISGLIAQENLPNYMASELYTRMAALPDQATWYDMISMLTSVGNLWRGQHHSRTSKLMTLGGRASRESVDHRCGRCGHHM